MNIAFAPRDSIARRFALTVVLTVVVTWSLAGLFNIFGGVWALPSLEQSGLLDQAANMVRIIQAAPPAIREQLASAATTPTYRVGWYAATSPVSTVLGQVTDQVTEPSPVVKTRLGGGSRAVRILRPDGSSDALKSTPQFHEELTEHPQAYVLAVQYSDDSWLVFTVPEKLWGLRWEERWAIWLLFLTVSTGIKYGTPPTIELTCEEATITIMVRDQGPGIPAESLERVFSPFYRLDSSRNRTTGGIGLGLTAALATIRGHGGDIVLSNRSLGGLEAVVTLPRIT
jgi:hypothetical protein